MLMLLMLLAKFNFYNINRTTSTKSQCLPRNLQIQKSLLSVFFYLNESVLKSNLIDDNSKQTQCLNGNKKFKRLNNRLKKTLYLRSVGKKSEYKKSIFPT